MRRQLSGLVNRLLWICFLAAGFYILFAGGQKFLQCDPVALLKAESEYAQRMLRREAARFLYPGLFFAGMEGRESASLFSDYVDWALGMHPLTKLSYAAADESTAESAVTWEMLNSGSSGDENELDETGEEYDLALLAEEENASVAGYSNVEQPTETEESAAAQAGQIYSLEDLSDFDYLLSNFYTVESNTMVTAEDLNAEELLAKDMTIDKDVDGPQILIYHTHSQEGFVDSVPGDNSTTIVGVGAYLKELLEEKGYSVMHVTSVYDLIDGELDRSEAYSRAAEEISAILEEYPSIQAVIDLHRDGVDEGTRLVAEIDGKTVARFMFFNGLSRTKNGNIDYLYNPYVEDNLALTLQLKLQCEQYYPGLSRNIYLKSLRYNLHLSDKALLIEAGAQTNTLEEVMNTMEPLADVLDKVFSF
ncbi:MAG: stage II sporulation protein P [Lachnospiraceae bacterium]|nr:stage II sporulation protein P [Lachnospiraceae bacterium]